MKVRLFVFLLLTGVGALAPAQSFDAKEMLRRLDENEDGLLQPGEITDRVRPFLTRKAQEAGLDLSQPVKLKDVYAALRSDSRSRESSASTERSSRGTRSQSEPLVPGFGEPDDRPKPFGFDVLPDSPLASTRPIEQRYEKRVIEYVDRILYRYDKNKNGQLDQEEWNGVRWSSPPPTESDLNHDGILSRVEFCERVAQRWGSQKPSSSPSSKSPSGFGRQSGSSSSSSGDSSRVRRYAEGLLRQYDANKNGVLEKDEWQKMRGYSRNSDANGDGILTLDELTARLSNYGKSGSSSAASTSDTRRSNTSSRSGSRYRSRDNDARSSSSDRKSYRFLTPAERLPKGLPDWFLRVDANADGQVMMSEYAAIWSDAKAAEFATCDLNGDGCITAAECLEAESSR